MNPFQTAKNYKKLVTIIGIYIAMITSILISSSSSILLPVAANEIGGLEYYPLATTLVSCLGIACMPLYGFIAAKSPSSKRVLGAVSFIIAGVIILSRGLATSMWAIVIPSVFLGVYSPAIYVLGYSTIRDMYDPKKAGIFLGLAGTMQSVGMLVGGPLVGGMVQVAGWRVPFFVIGPLFLIAGLLVLFGVKVTKEETKDMVSTAASFDFAGATAVVVFLSSFVLALSLGKLAPFGSTLNNILLAVAVVSVIALIIDINKKGAKAIIPSIVLKDVNTLSLTAFNFLSNFSMMAIFFFMPLYVSYVMKQPPAVAGLTITCMSVAGLFMGPIYGRMIGNACNARFVALMTTTIRIIATIALIMLLTPTTSIYVVFAIMILMGFASSAGGVVPAVGPQVQIAPEKRQLGNAVVSLGSGFGSTIAIAIYSMVIASAGVMDGMKISLYISMGAAVILFFTNLLLKKLPSEAPTGKLVAE